MANAAFWDRHMGDGGNDFHRELVAPAAERLLGPVAGQTMLEIACGSGLFARRHTEPRGGKLKHRLSFFSVHSVCSVVSVVRSHILSAG